MTGCSVDQVVDHSSSKTAYDRSQLFPYPSEQIIEFLPKAYENVGLSGYVRTGDANKGKITGKTLTDCQVIFEYERITPYHTYISFGTTDFRFRSLATQVLDEFNNLRNDTKK